MTAARRAVRRAPRSRRRRRARRRPAGPRGRRGAGRPAGGRAGRARHRLGRAHRRRDRHRGARAGRRAGRGAGARGGRLDRGRGLVGRRAVRARRRRRAQRARRPAGPARPGGGARASGSTPCRRPTAGSPSPEDAAAWYAEQLAAAAGARAGRVPRFDVLLLGMGPEGHVASIFPDSPAARDERPVFAVHDCPKPPPTRVSLGFSAINTAEEVWLLVSGEAKADAVAPGARRAPPRRSSRRPGCTARGRPAGCSTTAAASRLPGGRAPDDVTTRGRAPRPQAGCNDVRNGRGVTLGAHARPRPRGAPTVTAPVTRALRRRSDYPRRIASVRRSTGTSSRPAGGAANRSSPRLAGETAPRPGAGLDWRLYHRRRLPDACIPGVVCVLLLAPANTQRGGAVP